jgi:hypothetical protein
MGITFADRSDTLSETCGFSVSVPPLASFATIRDEFQNSVCGRIDDRSVVTIEQIALVFGANALGGEKSLGGHKTANYEQMIRHA